MKIKLRNFQGLMTNIDPADKPAEYFSKFKNIEVKRGYINGKKLFYEEVTDKYSFDGIVIRQSYVFLDEDKYRKKYDTIRKELVYDYQQNIQKFLLSVVVKDRFIKFYLDNLLIKNLGSFPYTQNEKPEIIENKNTVIILLKSGMVWIGKLHRTILDTNNQPQILYDGYYAEPFVDTFGKNTFPFGVEALTESQFKQQNKSMEVKAEIINDRTAEIEYEGLLYEGTRIAFRDLNDKPVKIFDSFKGSNGTVVAFTLDRFYDIDRIFYCIPKDYFDSVFRIDNQILAFNVTNDVLRWVNLMAAQNDNVALSSKIAIKGWDKGLKLIDNNYSESMAHADFYIFSPQYLKKVFDNNIITINPSSTVFSGSTSFTSNLAMEVAVTSIIDGNETIKYYSEISTPNESYILGISLKEGMMTYPNIRKEGYCLYVRTTDKTEEKPINDFEQIYTYQIYGDKQVFPMYFNKLALNGITLTQTIGKYFDPNTYEIINSLDDYVNVSGVPYGLKDGDVYYPAVGGGAILSNFYKENVIPGIKGNIITQIGNWLGVFIANKEEMILIDFTPVESQMIFYIKDRQSYKIRDKEDIIETAEGVFIHLKEGIYLTNGTERTLISEAINNIIRDYYSTGNIYYNSYLKQLLYINPAIGIFVLDFETKAWIEYSFPVEKGL